MKNFTGYQYLLIDIANCYGLDKKVWADRIQWTQDNITDLESNDADAKYPILFRKAVRALRRHEKGQIIDHAVGLDATASGIQIMAILTSCDKSAAITNLFDSGRVRSPYTATADQMCKLGVQVDTATMKKPVMTTFYGSTAQPRSIFGEGTPELLAYYQTLVETMPGPFALRNLLLELWDSNNDYHTWITPDNHVAHVPVTIESEKVLEIDEFNHHKVTFRTKEQTKLPKGLSLAANVVHSIDGWIVREMVRKAHQQGFMLAPIHDCFYAHPNHMNKVRQNYVDTVVDLYRMNYFERIFRCLTGKNRKLNVYNKSFEEKLKKAEYAIT